MKLTQIGMIYQLTFFPHIFPVNVYLIEEKSSLTLIDAGIPISLKGILKTADKIGKPLDRIVLTHAHSDHIGSLEKLKQTLPNTKIYISKRENKILLGDLTLNPNEPQSPIKGGVPKKRIMSADVLLEDGDTIESLTSIYVPGHTPGMMAFLDRRSNSLIVGDAFQLRGGIAVAGKLVPTFPFPSLATWNKELAIQSAEKLLQYEPNLLAAGHGAMLKNPVNAMKKAISDAKIALYK
ncbi:MBL fold metallo-hydrolase [Clostridium sp. YIM B02505]|uniref:MBL fold metallo-hydrolase n=1 Tax=Clostridium yunnanense TaxID=2800325 RepID=A0ABS1EKC5_9CLOT|nr:MBL fold metallo-hydrolase [Clostridium yunnanense]MBK1809804.1 MBL fold metallo-hydrolase [Clostridium yunnanense]